VTIALYAKRSKYGNRKTTVDGLVFDSAAEARRWCDLQLLERAGEISDLKRQVSMDCKVNGILVCRYVADFTYMRGPLAVVEDVKGMETALFRLKARLVQACHGHVVEIVKVRR
jgi:hypothetical protein